MLIWAIAKSEAYICDSFFFFKYNQDIFEYRNKTNEKLGIMDILRSWILNIILNCFLFNVFHYFLYPNFCSFGQSIAKLQRDFLRDFSCFFLSPYTLCRDLLLCFKIIEYSELYLKYIFFLFKKLLILIGG